MVDCKTVPLQVPAQAEVVLEGWLEPGKTLPEGPFGDHTGFYTPQETFPALTIDCVTMRKRPLLQSIVVGPAADGGRPARAGHGAVLPAAAEDHRAGHRGLPPAGGRRLPQLCDRLDRQEVPQARAEGHARGLGRAHDVADQADRGRRRRLRRPRPARGRLAGARQHRLRPRPDRRRGSRRPPGPRLLPAVLGRQGGHRRDEEAGPRRGTRGTAAGRRWSCPTRRRRRRSTAAGRSTDCESTAAPSPQRSRSNRDAPRPSCGW